LDVFQDIVQVVFPDQVADDLGIASEFEAMQQAGICSKFCGVFEGFLEIRSIWR
jgi:hypothetical protein